MYSSANLDLDASKFYKFDRFEDELIGATVWLYRAAGDYAYINKAESMYASRQQTWTSWSFHWTDKMAEAQLLLFELTGKDIYKADVEKFCDYAMGIQKSPKGQTHLAQWGSNRYASNFAFICLGVRVFLFLLFIFFIYNNFFLRLPMLESKLRPIWHMLINK